MKAVNSLSKFFATIFLIAFSVLILLMITICLAKTMIAEESISKHIGSADIFNSSSNEVLKNNNNNTLKQSISNKLLGMRISEEVTEKVLDSKELNIILTDYMYSYINSVLFNTDKDIIDNDDLIEIVQNKYFETEGKSLDNNQISMLGEYISELNLKLANYTPNINELESLGINIKILQIAVNICNYKYIWFVLGTFILAIYALISIFLKDAKKALKWCSNALVVDGFILVLFSFLEVKFLSMYINEKGIIENLVINMANKSFENLLFYGIGLIIVGLILLTIGGLILKKETKEKQEKSNLLLNSVIEDEIINSNKKNEDDEIKNDKESKEESNVSNKIEIEKVELGKIFEKQPTDKIIVNKNEEIPKIMINGKDFEKNDIDNIKANNGIYDENRIDNKNIENVQIREESNIKDGNNSENDFNNIELVEVEDSKKEDVPEKDFEETKEFEIIEAPKEEPEEETKVELENIDYEEIEDNIEEKIIKKDIKVFPVEEVKLDIVSPKKGKDIKVNLENLDIEEEEEIEIL